MTMAADKDMDRVDREILRLLATDASLSLADIADRVGLTSTPCWKRIRRMEQAGVIRGRVATIDPAKVGLPVSVFVEVETSDHSGDWLQRFAEVVRSMPEIVDAWRMSGDVDYLMHVVVRGHRRIRRFLSAADRCRAVAQRNQPVLDGAAEGGAAADLRRQPFLSTPVFPGGDPDRGQRCRAVA